MTGILHGLVGSFKQGFSNVWSSRTTLGSKVYEGATYTDLANGKYFAFGPSGAGTAANDYFYSNDGLTWSNGTLPSTLEWGATTSNSSTLIVFDGTVGTGSHGCAYSTNGTTWTSATVFGTSTNNYSISDGLWDGTYFFATAPNRSEGGLAYSTNGSTWTTIQIGTSGHAGIGTDGSGTYILTEGATVSTIRRCISNPTSSSNWNTVNVPSAQRWRNVVYGNGTWLINTAYANTYLYSTNGGFTWTAATPPNPVVETNSDTRVRFAFAFGKFYLYGTGLLYSSTDGITWTQLADYTSTTLDVVNDWAVGPDRIIAVGQDSPTAGTTTYLLGA